MMPDNAVTSEKRPKPGSKDPTTGEVPEGVEAQTEQSIDVVAASLSEVCARRFRELYPARTTIASELANLLVEKDTVAIRPTLEATVQEAAAAAPTVQLPAR